MFKSLDYSKYTASFTCVRKHVLKDVSYFVYIFDDRVTLSAISESQNPKYVIELRLSNRINWVLDKDQKLQQFGFEYRGQIKFFHARENDLITLKQSTSTKIMFKEVSDFYKPAKLLGRGGQSKVYLVNELATKQEFASKCVEKKYLNEDGGFQGLFNEIHLMQTINHSSIIKLQDIYEGENTFYLIMEYLKGRSLHDITTKGGIQGLQWEQIRLIMWQLLNGVAAMHRKGIMHRDLKPENIMFKEANSLNELRIVDFGLATSIHVEAYPFPKCGTPGYVAPEIANLKDTTHKYDLACDIFSIGCIFYKLITTKDLFPGTDYQDILRLNKKCNISLDALNIYRTPASAQDLIHQMLRVVPKDRITAAAALEHPFFKGAQNDKKMSFQDQKKNNPNSKLWQTTVFKCERSETKKQSQNKPEISQEQEEEHQDIADEHQAKKVPFFTSGRIQQHSQDKNLSLEGNEKTTMTPILTSTQKKRGFKKSTTQDFSAQSPDSPQSRDSGQNIVIAPSGFQFRGEKQFRRTNPGQFPKKYEESAPIQEQEEEIA